MRSRHLHALSTLAPAVLLAAGATAAVGLLVESARSDGLGTPDTVLAAMFAWPATIAAVSFLARSVRGIGAAFRRDPIRTLGIVAAGHAWRIPRRRRHPLSAAALAVAAAGGLIAGFAATGLLGVPEIWHLGVGIGGSIILGLMALAVGSVFDRRAGRSIVFDPVNAELIVPPTESRQHVARIALSRIRSIRRESYGPLGLSQRAIVHFDDDELGDDCRRVLMDGIDPATSDDLVVWLAGYVRSIVGMPAPAAPVAEPVAHAAAHAATHRTPSADASAPAPAAVPGPASNPSPAPAMRVAPAPASRTFAGGVGRARRGGFVGALAGLNVPAALTMLVVLGAAAAIVFGMPVGPRTSAADSGAAASVVEYRAYIGRGADGELVRADDAGDTWTWVIDIAPGGHEAIEQLGVVRRLEAMDLDRIRFRVCLVAGEVAGTAPDAVLAARVARRAKLAEDHVLVRIDPSARSLRHQLVSPEGHVVYSSSRFHAAATVVERFDDLGGDSAAAPNAPWATNPEDAP